MIINFKKLEEFNTKYPDESLNSFAYIIFIMLFSEDVHEETIKDFINSSDITDLNIIIKSFEKRGLLKIIGTDPINLSLRPLGLELIGEEKVDDIIELASKIRELFPKGVKSGGYLVRSSEGDIADKLRKFFKKHKYSHEKVLKATENYVNRKRNEGWAYMQRAIYFIEKDGSSNLAAECDNLESEVENDGEIDTMVQL